MCLAYLNTCMCVYVSIGTHVLEHVGGVSENSVGAHLLPWLTDTSHSLMEYTSLAGPGALRESPTSAPQLAVGTGITGLSYKPKTYTGSGDPNSSHAYMAIAKASAPSKVSFKAVLLPEDTEVLIDSNGLHGHLPQTTQVPVDRNRFHTGLPQTPAPEHPTPSSGICGHPYTVYLCVQESRHKKTQSKSYKNRIKNKRKTNLVIPAWLSWWHKGKRTTKALLRKDEIVSSCLHADWVQTNGQKRLSAAARPQVFGRLCVSPL